MKTRDLIFRSSLAVAVLALVSGLVAAPAVHATNGYFTHGYGTSSKGMAGAGVALSLDAMAAATNPASMAFVGKRYDAGVAIFNPNREYKVTGNPTGFPGTFGLQPGTVQSDSEFFFVPHFAGNWEIGTDSTLGVNIYGHGGMNTDYPTQTFYDPTSNSTGVNLEQLFISVPWAKKFGGKHAIGIAPVFVYQSFEIEGVATFGFQGFSANPAALSGNGADTSTGYGVKLGYLGQWTPKFSFGVSYQSEMSMDNFGDYAGLFAIQGMFDIPSSLTFGFGVKATDHLTVALDMQEIYYSDIDSIANPFANLFQFFQTFDQSFLLGGDNGPGFGWEDMAVFKLGLEWDRGNSWIWRFGFSTGNQPIPRSEVLFNILAPGVMEEHFSVGFTKSLGTSRALNMSLTHAPSVSVSGPNPMEFPGAQDIELTMDQWDLEFSFTWGL